MRLGSLAEDYTLCYSDPNTCHYFDINLSSGHTFIPAYSNLPVHFHIVLKYFSLLTFVHFPFDNLLHEAKNLTKHVSLQYPIYITGHERI
jgi:hypothetical protein